ncbi:secretin [Agaricicola taiwanensis]|uniref:Secretin n=1 Tax=Agaricicola taiwanensis TaxID=591372 RepID=A0A8J2YG29_9RHOB|nr:type II and III secretion system protein family protein [Agaricicola taiwanensis]GGE33188.1 secretin [Agaricicola taiwanensis]
MSIGGKIGRIVLAAAIACAPGAVPAQAADAPVGGGMLHYGGSKQVELGIGKSMVVELPRDASEVIVADPKIANAVVRSARRAFLIGVAGGATSIIFIDAQGQQIVALDVVVARDVGALQASLRTILPESPIDVRSVGDSIMVTGSVRSAQDAQTAVALAGQFVGDPAKVINSLAVTERDQVLLKVTVAEVQRNIAKQLGINWDAAYQIGTTIIGGGSNPGFAFGDALANIIDPTTGNVIAGGNGIGAAFQNSRGEGAVNLRALEENGVMRTLAEPNLTAISGETAQFLAGGEFPVPTGRTCTPDNGCNVSIEFKKFGVSLGFTPVVLTGGRISLKVNTEVSELSNEGAFTQTDGFTIPSLRVRRADTTVEVPSGGAIALAGMIQQSTRQAMAGIPGAKDIPIIGTLFRSRDFLKAETELVIFVTPYIAKATRPDAMARPDDGFITSSDGEAYFLGRMNKVYGIRPTDASQVGFIVD